jgi:hypothetical protein
MQYIEQKALHRQWRNALHTRSTHPSEPVRDHIEWALARQGVL